MTLEIRDVSGKKVVYDVTRGGALRLATDEDVKNITATSSVNPIPQPTDVIENNRPTVNADNISGTAVEETGVNNASRPDTATNP